MGWSSSLHRLRLDKDELIAREAQGQMSHGHGGWLWRTFSPLLGPKDGRFTQASGNLATGCAGNVVERAPHFSRPLREVGRYESGSMSEIHRATQFVKSAVEAAKECSPRRKPWVGRTNKAQAPEGRKKSHVSSGLQPKTRTETPDRETIMGNRNPTTR